MTFQNLLNQQQVQRQVTQLLLWAPVSNLVNMFKYPRALFNYAHTYLVLYKLLIPLQPALTSNMYLHRCSPMFSCSVPAMNKWRKVLINLKNEGMMKTEQVHIIRRIQGILTLYHSKHFRKRFKYTCSYISSILSLWVELPTVPQDSSLWWLTINYCHTSTFSQPWSDRTLVGSVCVSCNIKWFSNSWRSIVVGTF